MTLEGHHRVGVSGLDIIQLDIAVTSGSQVPLIRSDAETVHLGIGMLNGTRADPRQGLPEAEQSILAPISNL